MTLVNQTGILRFKNYRKVNYWALHWISHRCHTRLSLNLTIRKYFNDSLSFNQDAIFTASNVSYGNFI